MIGREVCAWLGGTHSTLSAVTIHQVREETTLFWAYEPKVRETGWTVIDEVQIILLFGILFISISRVLKEVNSVFDKNTRTDQHIQKIPVSVSAQAKVMTDNLPKQVGNCLW